MPADLTLLLNRLAAGDASATDELIERVYEPLRVLAERQLRREPNDALLQPTALVHEAFLRIVDQTRVDWKGRAHFFAIAAQMMRRVLVEHARSRAREKRGGGLQRITLHDEISMHVGEDPLDLLALDEALTKLAGLSPREAKVVELRIFASLSIDETAHALGISPRAVDQDWAMAKAWLKRELIAP